ncbi:hypothetical protein IEQ34_001426 [Dendrobium chrysotoxum]|uniref:peptidylprolyl isomerase n=1 Tax=Dendrobium chrysotoxum TaxID=161865 RepID=A0AAV7HQJ2_DENCH|nr:hypothetical protein IEQ34_001426 [Dendrobium chrysotoxum]
MGSQQLVVRNKGSTKEESEDDDGFPICFTVESTSSKKKKINDDKKRKVDGSTQDTVSVSEANMDRNSRMPAETASKHNEKSKKKKEKDEKRSIGSENDEKQNKHKENANVENNSETDAAPSKDIEGHPKESLNGVKDTDNDCDATVMSGDPDACKQSKKKSKKRRIREGASDEQDSINEDIDADKIPKEDEMTVDEPAATDLNVTKKKKKNKKKNKDSDIKHEELAKEKADLAVNGVDELKKGSQAIKTRTFPNGLIVEEVSMGKPDGKKASPGKKVSVRYIGKLKSGTIFDSNIGQKPFKFRLGIGEVIKGWDIGVSGMCVGDKRRLTIPPSFGYGAKGVGKIPPNSWLVFDVELVDVQ